MNFQKLKSISLQYIDEDHFDEIKNKMESIFEQDILFCIPSMEIGSDTPTLNSIFFISKDYIAESRLTGDREDLNYDVVRFDTIYNIRFSSSLREIVDDGVVLATICSAEVKLHHSMLLHTILNFVGTEKDRSDWLTTVGGIFKPSALAIRKI
ncbi:hypothetical protein [Janthinobacterium sp. RA13]|uniref:hypothetical protein n=1 Tax=Janthinobacterium sp. RA13 TaxID=1502762 RepID=UPI001269C226|nr:hypothetical protein [Janthinobacterium sp. RA13]